MRFPQEKEQKTKHHLQDVPECSTVSFFLPVLWLLSVVKMSRLPAFSPSHVMPMTMTLRLGFSNESHEDMSTWWKFYFDHGVLASVLPSGLWALPWPCWPPSWGSLFQGYYSAYAPSHTWGGLPWADRLGLEFPPSNRFLALTLYPPLDNWWQARPINSSSDECREIQAGSGFFLPCYFLPYTWMYTKTGIKPYIQ